MRSKYIYLVYQGSVVLRAFTVKHEAHRWLENSCWTPNDVCLVRMIDGKDGGERIDWDCGLFCLDDSLESHCKRAASQVEDWPIWAQGVLDNSMKPTTERRN